MLLPEPSGSYAVGTVALRLVDTVRPDPWVPQPYRELTVSLRYPASATGGRPGAPQMLPGKAAGFAALAAYTGVIGKDGNTPRTVPSWDALWRRSRGWHRGLSLVGAEHATYTDAEALIPQIARRFGLPAETVAANVGTVDPLARDRRPARLPGRLLRRPVARPRRPRPARRPVTAPSRGALLLLKRR
ncbi:hypothetical protein [Streptomyces sp. NPDC049040]|uniref:hypothetical protein n=1 Tax=Streptomyces sp. NPDC049040 TaxID=3365593 RepID=UPI003724129A